MKLFIDAHNTISAGTTVLTATFLDGLFSAPDGDRVVVVLPDITAFEKFKSARTPSRSLLFIPQSRGRLQIVLRLLYQAVVLPLLLLRHLPDRVFVFGNYLLMPWRRKTVFMQTPYIVDHGLLAQAPPAIRAEERIVRTLFRLTLLSTRTVVVQNTSLKQQLIEQFRVRDRDIVVLPSPVSRELTERAGATARPRPTGDKIVLFVSRYYRHKNHDFIVRLADRYRSELESRRIRFYMTVDPATGTEARALLENIRLRRLDKLIENLGEIPQLRLAPYYESAWLLFFPSRAETFGLPLVEAMSFGLPVVVPDLPYARAACGNAGVYFRPDDVADAFDAITRLCDLPAVREEYARRSREQVRAFPSVEAWTRDLMAVMKGRTE